jgi:HlyD family secretion protein
MSTTETNKQKLRGRLPLVVSVVIVVVAIGAFALARSFGSPSADGAEPTFRVRQGPLTISVVQPGTIKSLEQVSLKCEVEGQTTLIYLIPEGTQVKEGDLLVELDASRLQDELIQQQISTDNADAAFVRARENLAVAKNQAQSNISKAELDYRFAKEDVTQYVDGLLPKETKEAESNITLAREELERAAEKLEWSQRLYDEKFIAESELEADRLTHNRAQLNHELAVASLQLLKDFTSKRKLDELNSNVEQMAMALERVKLQANADIVQAEADLKAKETELSQQRSKLEKTELQLTRTKIYAPRDGLAVYATSVETGGRRWRREPLQEGQAVRERQELIYLPSAESMMAEVQIHESSLEKVQIGQPVRLTVDALPGEVYSGRVAKIAPLPDAQSAWLNPDLKVYPTEIHLDGVHPELRTGMSCQAEIIVAQYPNALYVPVQAVLQFGKEPRVYLRTGNRFEPEPIKIGLDNNSMVHVLAGLEPGQEVLLTPPLEAKTETAVAQVDATPQAAEPGAASAGTTVDTPGAAAPSGPGGRTAHRPGGPEAEAGGGPPAGGDMPDMSEARRRFQNMSEEERAKMRERFQNMSPEERERLFRQRGRGGRGGRERRGGGGGDQE